MSVDETYSPTNARYYDLFWTARSRQLARGIEALMTPAAPMRILDLCCGTGHTVELLAGRGHHVTGLDLSESMVRCARERLADFIAGGSVKIIAGDAAAFDLGEQFDVITSAFWSLNEVPDPAIRQALGCVARHLTPTGIFIAELMTTVAERAWDGQAGLKNEAGGMLTRQFVRLPDGGVLLFHRGYGTSPDGEVLPFSFKTVLHGHDPAVVASELMRHGVPYARAIKVNASIVGSREMPLDEPCEDYVLIASRDSLDFVSTRLPAINQALRAGVLAELERRRDS